MTEPRTAAGRALLDKRAPYAADGAPEKDVKANLGRRAAMQADILAIEAEAADDDGLAAEEAAGLRDHLLMTDQRIATLTARNKALREALLAVFDAAEARPDIRQIARRALLDAQEDE
jgi:hypothetical protein